MFCIINKITHNLRNSAISQVPFLLETPQVGLMLEGRQKNLALNKCRLHRAPK